ncbi:hypothetical protein PF005_g1884 [Phytophthora fragariae]|uniref:Uncharacterized protein n=1 Tax=Phytophthora fragariae TaxID=53985 RepID=A0A6A3UU48_9STRA|nr:hypothetical protein PF003_g25003 [Phytophthora fragariae]KAE8947718.1 hypothetical protein PF009_g2671 [Phytophthora fragariae]KAE9135497.1 hypothetical protein PF007_g2531 [Phytophthora fragariae]KAE9154439.1 hypothetical protein PF006_g1506 [Phytophthora fragariae]KAE9234494.1 hypothetical protein PF005_g1884 [Phytophthora fragariae]
MTLRSVKSGFVAFFLCSVAVKLYTGQKVQKKLLLDSKYYITLLKYYAYVLITNCTNSKIENFSCNAIGTNIILST